jgi:hypothetical protein
VVLVTVDGLVPQELGVFGGDVETPALERVAAMGSAWEDAWTAVPMTRPGVATYLTGLAPDRHRVRDDLFAALDPGTPTLATLFSEAGYRTGAFPDAASLGSESGLLRGFEVVADPPHMPTDPRRWLPLIQPPEQVAGNFESWLDTLGPEERYFAWIHLSDPLLKQLWDLAKDVGLREEKKRQLEKREIGKQLAPPGTPELDAALGTILDALERRGDLERALIVVAGTQGDATGDADQAAGQGMSIGLSAIQVPVVLGWADAAELRPVGQPVWAPDVPATLARVAGLELSEDAEGISLLESVPADRIVMSWSWATLDQLGWRAQRAARSGRLLRVEGLEAFTVDLEDPQAEVAEADAARLAEALALRAEPAAPAVPLQRVRPILEAQGVTINPVPSEGRSFGNAELRREISRKLLAARGTLGVQIPKRVLGLFESAIAEDPENLGINLDFGQMIMAQNPARAKRLLGKSLGLYPTNPELLHWYAHAIWSESWQTSEEIIELILPYKPQEGDVLYDLACTKSLAGNLDESEEFLRRAIAAGYREFNHMETDPDLRALRQDGRLSEVLKDFR